MEILKTITANGKTFHNVALCQCGTGAPTSQTVGQVGQLYMNTDSGEMYKCTAAADEMYTWESVSGGGYVLNIAYNDAAEDQRETFIAENLDWEKLLHAVRNGQCVLARVFHKIALEEDNLFASGDFILTDFSEEESFAVFTYIDYAGDQILLEVSPNRDYVYQYKRKIGSNIPLTITITIDQDYNVSCDTRYDEIYNAVGANRAVLAMVNDDSGQGLVKRVLPMGTCHYGASASIMFGTQLALYDDNTWEYQP